MICEMIMIAGVWINPCIKPENLGFRDGVLSHDKCIVRINGQAQQATVSCNEFNKRFKTGKADAPAKKLKPAVIEGFLNELENPSDEIMLREFDV
jgi:hypothetical protein